MASCSNVSQSAPTSPSPKKSVRDSAHRPGMPAFDEILAILHLLGVDHTKLTFKYQGTHFRLTDVHGNVVSPILA